MSIMEKHPRQHSAPSVPSSSPNIETQTQLHQHAYQYTINFCDQSLPPATSAVTASSVTSALSSAHQQQPRTVTMPALRDVHPYDSMHDEHFALTSSPPFASRLVDDFDSYMFPDVSYSPTETSVPSDENASSTAGESHVSTGSIDWQTVDSARVYSPDGSLLDTTLLYTGYSRLSVLVFLPRHAVELAALVYGKLAHLLQQASARLVFVTPWTPEQATTFLSRFERVTPFPGSVVCDPHAALFSAVKLTRSPLRALFSATKMSAPMRQGMRNAFSTVTYRAANRDIASTPVSSKRLKGGAAVMTCLRGYARRPDVLYLAEENMSTGLACYLDVLSTCGVNDAFVPEIDVAQLYARFNSMRVTSIKARTADEKEANRLAARANQRSSRKNDRRNTLKRTSYHACIYLKKHYVVVVGNTTLHGRPAAFREYSEFVSNLAERRTELDLCSPVLVSRRWTPLGSSASVRRCTDLCSRPAGRENRARHATRYEQ